MRLKNEIKLFINKNYNGIGNIELTKLVNNTFNTNISIQQIKSYKANNHLNSGITCQFKNGHIPFNKGKNIDEYMSKENQEKCKTHRFTKGKNVNNQRWKWRELGEERITKDGYIEVKVETNKWKLKHRILFEKYNNTNINDEDVVIFANGNLNDFSKENLKLITRQELLFINQNNLIKDNIETTDTGINLTRYILKLKELKGE